MIPTADMNTPPFCGPSSVRGTLIVMTFLLTEKYYLST